MLTFGETLNPPGKEGKEKHVPVIEAPASVKAGEAFEVTVVVGKDVPHPNTIEHHIQWIQVFAHIEGRPNNPVHVATFECGPTFAAPTVTFPMMLESKASLIALEYCNIHGVWENSVVVGVK
jgi:superoxide reductase